MSRRDPLSAARGLVNGVLLSVVLWLLIGAAIYFNVHV